jgi:hypothetical protein
LPSYPSASARSAEPRRALSSWSAAYGPSTAWSPKGHGDPRERVLGCARADREHRNAEGRGEVSRPEDERFERPADCRDPLHLDEPTCRLDLHLEPDARREALRDGGNGGGGNHLRNDDDVDLRRERRL